MLLSVVPGSTGRQSAVGLHRPLPRDKGEAGPSVLVGGLEESPRPLRPEHSAGGSVRAHGQHLLLCRRHALLQGLCAAERYWEAHEPQPVALCRAVESGRLHAPAPSGEAEGWAGHRLFRPERHALRRLLRTQGLHPLAAQLGRVSASAYLARRAMVLQQEDGQGVLSRLRETLLPHLPPLQQAICARSIQS